METIYLSKLCILACIVAFLLVTSCPASLGLIPYSSPNQYISEPPQKARKLDLSPQSCELICYNATNPAEPSNFNNHINFVCGSDGFTYLNFEELECVRKSCSRDIRFWRYGRCPRIQSLFSLDFRKQETQDEDVVNQKENQIRLPNIDRSLLKYFSREQISPNNCNHAEARPGGSGQIVHQESLVFPSPSSTKDDRGEGTPMFLRPFHRQGKKICLPDECGCPEEFRPICGSDSVTYGSECLLKCNLECNPGKQLLEVGCIFLTYYLASL